MKRSLTVENNSSWIIDIIVGNLSEQKENNIIYNEKIVIFSSAYCTLIKIIYHIFFDRETKMQGISALE